MNQRTFRIISACIILASVVWGYWWFTWALIIIALFIFPLYYEIILWGVMYDALYGLPISQFYHFRYIFTVASFLFFLIALYLKKYLLAYEDTI